MRKIQQHNALTNAASPDPLDPPTTRAYLESAASAVAARDGLKAALLAGDAGALEARLAAFSQARAELRAARAALLQDAARWVRAMFRPWKGVRHG